MSVRITSFQSGLFNYLPRQHAFKPIVLLVAGIALAIISYLMIHRTVSPIQMRGRKQKEYRFGLLGRDDQVYYNGKLVSGDHGSQTYRISPTIDDLQIHPYQYIHNLADAIKFAGLNMRVEADFRNVDGSIGIALDSGGPTRQFLNLLFESLKTQNSFDWATWGKFHKHTNASGTLLVPQGTSTDHRRVSIFHDIGIVMMYVYFNEESPLIGSVFHTALFAAILSLSDDEINTPYDQLNDAVKVKMCKALIHTQHASGEFVNSYLEPLALLEKGEQATDAEINSKQILDFYAHTAFESGENGIRDRFLLPGGDEVTLSGVQFDMDAIRSDKKGFLQNCLNDLLQQKTSSFGTLGLTLFPIHTMAKAMKELARGRWGEVRSYTTNFHTVATSSETADPQIEAAKRLQCKIQGLLDREVLVSKIEVSEGSEEIVKQQTDWIKEWILDSETTDSLLEKLLTFWTGSSYIDWDRVTSISVSTEGAGLLPIAMTCTRCLYVSNRRYPDKNARGEPLLLHNMTKEGFYQVLNKTVSEYSSIYTNF
jgi:hypothetical protein